MRMVMKLMARFIQGTACQAGLGALASRAVLVGLIFIFSCVYAMAFNVVCVFLVVLPAFHARFAMHETMIFDQLVDQRGSKETESAVASEIDT